MANKEPRIDGAQEIVAQIGEWPSFHDSEVLHLDLRRGAKSTLMLLLADSPEPNKRSVVEFVLEDVTGMELSEFNEQNVIASLDVEETHEGAVIRLSPCYGVNGWIAARRVEVRILSKE